MEPRDKGEAAMELKAHGEERGARQQYQDDVPPQPKLKLGIFSTSLSPLVIIASNFLATEADFFSPGRKILG